MLLENTEYRRFLFYEIFIKNNNVYLITTYYPDIIFDFKKVKVEINDEICNFVSDNGYNNYEPHRTVIYSFNTSVLSENNVKITFETQTGEYIVRNYKKYENKNILITMFKDDYSRIEWFVKYYKKLGVENFVFAYNGKLSNIEEKLYKEEYIEYIEYIGDYWVHGFETTPTTSRFKKNVEIIDSRAARNWHGAHSHFINACSIKYDSTSSIINVDLDEFIISKKENIYKILENYDFIILRTTFCKSDEFPFVNNSINLKVSEKHCRNGRQKYIINCKKLKKFTMKEHNLTVFQNHKGLNTDLGEDNKDLFIYHITNEKRECEMSTDTREEILFIN